MGIRPYPSSFDRYALEDDREDNGDTPACDKGEDDVTGILKGFANTEEAVVEQEDGDPNEAYADTVEYFICDGRLLGMIRDAPRKGEGGY